MRLRDILFLLPIPFVALSYIAVGLTNDAKIFHGVARLVDYYGSFPGSLDAAWEMKPLGNRLIHYLLYKIVTPLTDFGSPLYPVLVKSICVVIALVCCWYFATSFKKDTIPIFSVTALAVLTPMNFVLMQAEWFAVLVALVCVGLLYRDSLTVYTLSGMLMFFMFLLKGITGLLIIPVVCFLFIVTDNPYVFFERCAYAVLGFFLSAVTFFALCLTVLPHAIPDMLMAAQLARVGQYSVVTYLNTLFNELVTIPLYIPAMFFTLVIGLYLLITVKLPRDKFAALLLMWLVPVAVVFLQGEFFKYHFFVMILPGILSVAYLAIPADREVESRFYPIILVPMLILWLVFNSYAGIITSGEIQFYKSEAPNSIEANALFNISEQPSVLFLDPGAAPYHFSANSSCRYSTPMPVQRHREEWNVSHLPAYAEEYECIMQYDGRYIIGLDWWFGKDMAERKEIYGKIDREYVKVWNRSWDIYQRKV